MKTIEQKALAYDEALEIARKELLACGSTDCDAARQIFRLFPELKENEDEKIRKEIISFIQDHIDEINLQVSGDYDTRDKEDIALQEWCKRSLAWLEKQGTSYTKRDVDNAYVEGMAFAKDELKKQGEHWSEEDEKGWRNTMIMIKEVASNHYTKDSIKLVIDWLKSLKNRVLPQPIHEYSDTEKQEMFLRTQRPHFWRPSKGQLECLDVAIDKVDKDHSPFFTNRAYLTLKALKKQLEQL